MEIDICASLVAKAARFAARSPHEKYGGLHGIRVEPHNDGAVIVTTDSHWMFVGIDDTGYADKAVTLNVTSSTRMQLADPLVNLRLVATNKRGLRLLDKRTEVHCQPESATLSDQSFPDWRIAVERYTDKLKLGYPAIIDTPYLHRLSKLMADDPNLGRAHFYVCPNKVNPEFDACIVRFPACPSIAVIGMPYVEETPDVPTTEWVARFIQAAPVVSDEL